MSAQKRRVERTFRQFRALLILVGGLRRDHRAELEATLQAIPSMKKRDLLEQEQAALKGIEEIRESVGLRASLETYEQIVTNAEKVPYDMLFAPKWYVQQALFEHFERAMPRWELFPPHTRVGFDVKGLLAFTGYEIEWRLLEASLFEDLAMLWNEALASEVDDSGKTGAGRIPGKRFRVLKRAAVKACFALVEGYLNGLATDILHTRARNSLSPAALELLEEQDADGRVRFKTLRDKLLQYPRIALELEHPALQESNCPEMELLLRKEREIRDALVHPTPRAEATRPEMRERAFYELKLADVATLIDSLIALLRKVDALLDGHFGRVALWIRDRGADGRFPEETFY